MKHKLLTLLLAVMASVGMSFAETYSGSCGENLTWSLNTEDGVLTISGTGAMADYEYVEGGFSSAPWNDYRETISSLEFQLGVTSIGEYAFYQCRHLTTVTLPSSVISIGRNAFDGCANLISATIPNSVTTIGWYAFSDCTNLSSVTIPESVTELGIWPFQHCSGLTSIDVASTNPEYSSTDGVLFYKTESSLLKYPAGKPSASYIIPDNTASISDFAFEGSTHLTSVTIPNSVTDIRSYAFRNCENLASLTIPNSVTRIGGYAFLYCTGLTSVICKAITPPTIASTAFYGVDISIPLYVPAQSVAAYQAADVWKEFGNILAIDDSTEEVNYATLADIYNMAADSAFTLGAFDVVYVPSFQNGSNMYIKDSTGSGVIYMPNYGLQAGDHVEAGLQGKVSIYHGLHEIAPVSTKEELTITSGEVPAPMEATEVPSATNVNQYVIYKGVSFSTDTAFVEGKRHAVNGIWNGQTITFYNQYYMSATLSAGKTYNIIAVNTIYGTILQAYPLAVEEVSSDTPDSCVIASGTCGNRLTWELSCDSVLTISGTGAMTSYSSDTIVPWSSYRTSIASVVVGEGITRIANYSFQACENLRSVTLPTSVTEIRYFSFCGCTSLISIEIPNSVTIIRSNAFWDCDALTSIAIPYSVTNIQDQAFRGCNSLNSINVDSENPNYTSVDGVLFNKEATELIQYPAGKNNTSYSIPNSVTSIGKYAFYDCNNLTSVEIPNSVTLIGWGAFCGCDGLTSVTIPNSVTSIGDYAFSYCNSLTTVTLPDSITSISMALFEYSNRLTSVIIPDGVTSIGYQAFLACSGLTSITIPNSVISIENYAFYGCRNLTAITNYAITPQTINTEVFSNFNKSTCTLYVPAESVEAYKAAEVWKEFGNILAIEDEPAPCIIASGTCGAEGDNLTWTLSCDSVLTVSGTGAMADYSINNPAPWYSYVLSVKTVVVNEGVTGIGQCAFMDCSGLTSVAISNSVTSIGGGAFARCANLSSVTIPNSVISIGDSAFQSCIGMTSVTIPNSVTSIWDYAFIDCRSLTYINIPNSVTSIGVGAFMWCESLTSVMIPDNVTYIAPGAFACCTSLNSINVANDNTNYISIEGVLFAIKTKTILKQYPAGKQGAYTIPNNVTSIGSRAFEGSSGLTSVVIPNGVTNIGSRAFYGCDGLTSITNYTLTPQAIDSTTFESVNLSACTLYVPAESVEAYQAADVWKDFGNILPINGSDNPEQEIGCIDYLNLDNAVCYVNNSSPSNTETFEDFVVRRVDNGPASMSSRHTVHFDRTETEPRTGGQAKTIPDGEFASVRLGNWDSGNQAERIEYTFEVDTARPILLVKYMPLLEAPGHADFENPRFKIDVLINGQSLGSCSWIDINADNVMSGSVLKPEAIAQGWHITPSSVAQTLGDIVWKEWTTIGIDLSTPMYQGKSLTVRLTTHDCTFSAHCGYAYFTLGCTEKKLISSEDSVFIAPKGFMYRWMAASSEAYRRADGSLPDEYILSRSRDFHAETGGLYVVDCMSVQDSTCYFSLDASLPNSPEVIDPDTPSPEERTGQSTEGRDFWVTFMQADQDPNNDLVLSLSISSRENCQVQISNPYTEYMESFYVTGGQTQIVQLYQGNVLLANARTEMANSGKVCYAGYSEQVDTCALRVTATSDISLFATNYKRATFDATNVLPTALLGDEYIIQTYTPSDHGGVDRSQGSHFAIIATEDNTIVDYCPTVMTQAITDSVNVAQAKRDFMGEDVLTEQEKLWLHYTIGDTIHTPVLMAGQVFYVWTGKKDGETGDLSGTYVKARNGKRIAVFQGNPHTNIPYQVKQRDQLYSQAMPVRYWGNTFALTSSATRPSDIIRVMAVHDGTEVYINGEPVHTFDFTVDTKHFWEFEIGPSGTYAQEGSCMLATSHPVGVHLFLTSQQYYGDKNSSGDPAMTWVSPIDQQMDQVTFATYESATGGMTSYVNVVTDRPELMTLDALSIASDFSPVSGSNIYYYARIPLSYASHTLKSNGSRFNAHVYGINSNESYAFSAGSFIEDLSLNIYINGEPVSPVNDMCVSDTLFMDITTSFDYQSMKLDFGDGTVVYATDEEGIHARHAYDAPGVYHANVVVASNNNRLDSIPIRIFAGPLSLTYEPLNYIYVGDSIFYIYYHSPIQEMQIDEDFTIDRSFNDAALQDGFGHYTTRLNRSFFGIRIPEGARAGVEYAFNVDIHTPCGDYTATIPFVLKARRTGSCGDNLALTWTYDAETKTLTITGNGALNSNYTFGLEAPLKMEQLIIAEGVTSIGANAFSNMSTLQTMQLPASLKTIGASAFENDINLTAIYNYRERPCLVDATAFNGVNKFDCTLYVLEGSVDMYKSSISDWKDFYFILPIGTTEVTEPVSDVTVEPHDNSATVTWPTSNNAATYTIQITKDGVLFCTLIFNANGQLTGIAFAPGREGAYHAPAAIMTANGLQFTVTGLNSNTKYSYSVTAKDGNDVPVATYSGEFTTTSEGIATGVEEVSSSLPGGERGRLILHNGQIFILRGEKVYTVTGQEVK